MVHKKKVKGFRPVKVIHWVCGECGLSHEHKEEARMCCAG